jgi:hypothetical protein
MSEEKKLSKELGKIFAEEIGVVIQKEIDNGTYLSQESFDGDSMARAKAMIQAAIGPVEKTLAGAIATHRKVEHDEDTGESILEYTDGLTEEQTEIATRGWWGG